MSQYSPPTYTPPNPVYAMSGADAQQQGYGLAQQEYGPQMNAQAQGIADINQGAAYYNNFGPSTLGQAVGNQYMSNIWPQEQSLIQNQFANSGMQNSPALANTEANAYGNVAANVGQYEQGISNTNATNNLSQLMSINPQSFVNPITNNILGQSNINTQEQNSYNQAAAQQQYQQAYNKYSQQNAFASTLGQLSPIGGQIYGAATGTSGSAFSGTASDLGSAANMFMAANGMPGGGYGGNSAGAGLGFLGGGNIGAMYGSTYAPTSSGNGAPSLSSGYSGGAYSSPGAASFGGGSMANMGNSLMQYQMMQQNPMYSSMMGGGSQGQGQNGYGTSYADNASSGYGMPQNVGNQY